MLDWDLAAEGDPAEDLASLAGWQGWDLAPQLADPDMRVRAEIFPAPDHRLLHIAQPATS